MFAGEGAGGALVVAADFALGELVEEPLALFVEGLGCDYFAAEIAEVGEPVSGVEGELGVDLFAQALGEGGAGSGGGDGDLEISAADHGWEVEVAEGWVVDRVAEDTFFGGFSEDGSVDGGVVGGRYYEEVSGEITLLIGALMELELAGCGPVEDTVAGLRSDDGDLSVGRLERLDLGLG